MRTNLPSLTGLRYLAATVVFFNHVTPFFDINARLTSVSAIGFLGVEFFFVLSGFILTWTYQSSVSTGTFYRRRFARIYPLYVLTWIAAAILEAFGPISNAKITGWLLGLFLLQAWTSERSIDYAGNGPGWSLSAEAFFYAVFPFLVGCLPRKRSAVLIFVAAVTVLGIVAPLAPFYSDTFVYRNPVYGLLYFAAGMILARYMRNVDLAALRLPALPIAVTLAVVGFLVVGAFANTAPRSLVEAIMLPLVVLLIASAARSDLAGVRSFWSTRPLILLGQWSYAVYLIHMVFLNLIQHFVAPMQLGSAVGLVGTVVLLAITTAIAAAAYYIIERPAEALLRGSRRSEPTALQADPM